MCHFLCDYIPPYIARKVGEELHIKWKEIWISEILEKIKLLIAPHLAALALSPLGQQYLYSQPSAGALWSAVASVGVYVFDQCFSLSLSLSLSLSPSLSLALTHSLFLLSLLSLQLLL